MAPACGAAVLLAIGAVATFGDAVLANGFGARLSPRVGAEGGVVGFIGKQTIQNVLEVGPHVQIVAQGTADQREEVGGTFTRRPRTDPAGGRQADGSRTWP